MEQQIKNLDLLLTEYSEQTKADLDKIKLFTNDALTLSEQDLKSKFDASIKDMQVFLKTNVKEMQTLTADTSTTVANSLKQIKKACAV